MNTNTMNKYASYTDAECLEELVKLAGAMDNKGSDSVHSIYHLNDLYAIKAELKRRGIDLSSRSSSSRTTSSSGVSGTDVGVGVFKLILTLLSIALAIAGAFA
ncbi:MAG: hypothetical protein MRY83_09440 [Flavobacteriales bacterium]|nr:hypothetical protein [Flavobacteriales bacterium]